VRSADEAQLVVLVEGEGGLPPKEEPCPPGADAPARYFVRVGPQEVAHGAIVGYLLFPVYRPYLHGNHGFGGIRDFIDFTEIIDLVGFKFKVSRSSKVMGYLLFLVYRPYLPGNHGFGGIQDFMDFTGIIDLVGFKFKVSRSSKVMGYLLFPVYRQHLHGNHAFGGI
jgi:hypothetical protein